MIYSDVERAECIFYEFFKQAWPCFDSSEYVDNWHVEAIARHLEACYYRKIDNLLINIPPRTSKTLLISVAFPAWVWIHNPGETFYCASVDKGLALEAADKSRQIIESDWYRERWGDRVRLVKEQNAKSFFKNSANGHRMSTSARSRIVGRGGTIQISDDLNEIDESFTQRETTRGWWTRWYNRTGSYGRSVKIVVQQRTHEQDISGIILANEGKKWTTLILPNEFEESRRSITTINGKKFWEDPRCVDGEFLSKKTVGEEETREHKKILGSYGYAGQYQQRPAPAEGGILKKTWFKLYKQKSLPRFEHIIQSWDTAITDTPTAAYSACTTWGVFYDDNDIGNVMLLSMWRGRVNYPELRDRAIRVYKNYLDTGVHKAIVYAPQAIDVVLIEAKATGDPLIQDLRRAGIAAQGYNPTGKGDKEGRVQKISHFIEGGLIWLPTKPPDFTTPLVWADEFLDLCARFPNAESNDIVDSMTQVLSKLRDTNFLDHPRDEKKIEQSVKTRQLY